MIINANALHLPIASGTVQTVVTSPPYYGLRSYGIGAENGEIGLEQSPDEYIANLVAVFREVWRVLRDDGTIWVNLGDSYAGSGKGGQSDAKRSVNWQPDYANKGLIPSGLKPKDLIGIPWRVAFALQADGWWLRSDIIWSKPNPMPESVTDRPTKAHEYIFLMTKSSRYFWDADAVREESKNVSGGGFSQKYAEAQPDHGAMKFERGDYSAGRNIRSVWTIATQPTPYAHFATFPEKLVEPCIKAGSKPGDIVFDPFAGSGTVERVAIRLGRRPLGVELNRKYISEIATRRTAGIQVVLPLEASS